MIVSTKPTEGSDRGCGEVQMLNAIRAGDQLITVHRNSASTTSETLDILVLNLFTFANGKRARMQTFPSDPYALDRSEASAKRFGSASPTPERSAPLHVGAAGPSQRVLHTSRTQ